MFTVGIAAFCILLFLLYIINLVKMTKIKKEYKIFMQKLGNGENIQDILDKHIEKINKTLCQQGEW